MVLEGAHRRKDGTPFPVEVSVKYIPGQNEDYLVAVVRDITERRRTENELKEYRDHLEELVEDRTKELKEAQAQYEDLYDYAPDMYASEDAKTAKILQCNQTLADTMGYTKEEIIGRPVFDMYHPDCMKEVKKAFNTFVTTGVVHDAELQLKRKDGSKIDILLNASAVRDEQGQILYSRSSYQDITGRKRAEEELRKTNLELDAFVYSASHDLRAPLRSLMGFLEQCDEQLQRGKVDHVVTAYLPRMKRNVTKLDELVKGLLGISRADRMEYAPEPIDFDGLLQDIEEGVEHLDGAGDVKVQKSITLGTPFRCERVRLYQILSNLMSNSIKFRHPDRSPEIEIRIQTGPDHNIEIRFADNGKGITDLPPGEAFKMFVRGPKGFGSGLGLYLVQKQVDRLGGSIEYETSPEGTVFTITLPHQGVQSDIRSNA